MKQLWWLTVAEIRLMLRSKTFWLLGLLTVALSLMTSLHLLLILFIAVTAFKRDERVGLTEIFAVLPYNVAELYLARALAALSLLTGMWPLMLAVISGVTGTAEWLTPEAQLALLTLKYLTTCITAIGFIFLAGAVTRSSLQLYLVTGAGWAVGFIFASNLRYFPDWSVIFALGHGMMLPSAPSAALGYFHQQGLLPGIVVFQCALAVLFLLGAIAWEMRKRRESSLSVKRLLVPALLTVVVGLAAGGAVLWELEGRSHGYRLALQGSYLPAAAKGEPIVKPDLVAYRLDLNLQTATHALGGTANLKLKWDDPTVRSLTFTLRPYFIVRKIKLAGHDGPLAWRRGGSRLTVWLPEEYPPRKTATLQISYSGTVWEWSSGLMVRPNGPVNLIAPAFSLLRSGYAWYPVPGAEPLYTWETYQYPGSTREKTAPWARRVSHDPVPFVLTVKLDNNNMAVSNLTPDGLKRLTGKYQKEYRFRSRQGRDVFLIAGPYHHEKRAFANRGEWLDVYCFRQHRRRLNRVWESLIEPYQFYEAMFQSQGAVAGVITPAGKTGTVVEIPSFFSFMESQDLLLTDTVLLLENYFRVSRRSIALVAEMQANKRDLAILQRWWAENPVRYEWERDGQIGEGLLLYFATLGLEKRWGRDFYKVLKGNYFKELTLPILTGGPVVREVFAIMKTLRDRQTSDLVIKQLTGRLYRIYSRQRRIDPGDFSREVETALTQRDIPKARIDEIRRRLFQLDQEARKPERRLIRLKYSLPLTIVFNQEEWVP
jgi:hypothetical protein